jgi:hypothetical protein
LLVDQQLGVTNDVDEQNVPDLEFHVWGLLGRHGVRFIWKAGI